MNDAVSLKVRQPSELLVTDAAGKLLRVGRGVLAARVKAQRAAGPVAASTLDALELHNRRCNLPHIRISPQSSPTSSSSSSGGGVCTPCPPTHSSVLLNTGHLPVVGVRRLVSQQPALGRERPAARRTLVGRACFGV